MTFQIADKHRFPNGLAKGVIDLIERSKLVGIYVSKGSADGRDVYRGPKGGHFYLKESCLVGYIDKDNVANSIEYVFV